MSNQQQTQTQPENRFKGLDIAFMHEKYPQFYKPFMAFLTEVYGDAWKFTMNYREVVEKFYIWFNGAFFASSIYSEAKKNLEKNDRKEVIKSFENSADSLESYLNKNISPVDQLESLKKRFEDRFGKGSDLAEKYAKGVESLLNAVKMSFAKDILQTKTEAVKSAVKNNFEEGTLAPKPTNNPAV